MLTAEKGRSPKKHTDADLGQHWSDAVQNCAENLERWSDLLGAEDEMAAEAAVLRWAAAKLRSTT